MYYVSLIQKDQSLEQMVGVTLKKITQILVPNNMPLSFKFLAWQFLNLSFYPTV